MPAPKISFAERNRALLRFVRGEWRRRHVVAAWELPSYLFAAGFYRHPFPPDPIGELWPEDNESDDRSHSPARIHRLKWM